MIRRRERMSQRKEEDWTSIPLMKETVERLKKIGNKGETYDDIVRRLMKEVET